MEAMVNRDCMGCAFFRALISITVIKKPLRREVFILFFFLGKYLFFHVSLGVAFWHIPKK